MLDFDRRLAGTAVVILPPVIRVSYAEHFHVLNISSPTFQTSLSSARYTEHSRL